MTTGKRKVNPNMCRETMDRRGREESNSYEGRGK